ncbi:hypothetical protein [Roseomonas fluvialis]|uniref:Uncharacterized protein n=1 Tax=Roseomonas fluvialis TaxID=1750527 RepID=A0ABN6P8P2_9PROT|nr:hypothetical protein [Roseomonas fluvialis]BDG75298.1 hypothetical protein Rmf_52270 [Roseomonas fluvialis]
MSDAWISTLAALGGTFVGAFSTFASTTLTQIVQGRQARGVAEHAARRELYGKFLEELAQVIGSAMAAEKMDYGRIASLFALEGRICLIGPPDVVAAADGAIRFAMELYDSPAVPPAQARAMMDMPDKDWIKVFAHAARADLDRLA